MRKKKDEIKKPRTIRLSDRAWEMLVNLKGRDDKSWDLFIEELTQAIKYFKNL